MTHSRGSRLVSQIGTGGHGRRNRIGDDNQSWKWLSPTAFSHPPPTIKATTTHQHEQQPSEKQTETTFLTAIHSPKC